MRDWRLKGVLAFATKAHEGQTRKHTGEPYITHPIRVAFAAAEAGLTRSAIAAALLHDVIEDTDYTLTDIMSRYGAVVTEMVWGLTNAEARGMAEPGVDNRATRKAMDREWLGTMVGPDVKTLKVLDMLDNLNDWPVSDKFLDIMLDEMSALMQAMSEPGVDGMTGGILPGLVDEFWVTFEEVQSERDKFTTPPDEARDEGL